MLGVDSFFRIDCAHGESVLVDCHGAGLALWVGLEYSWIDWASIQCFKMDKL